MVEIELSIMRHSEQTAEVIKSLLDKFEAQRHIHVELQILDWSTARSELNKMALYHRGPDVSEIGTTWVGDLVGINVLHPLSHTELSQIGSADDFLKVSWETGHQPGVPFIWSIPWLTEVFAIHYRKDLLKKAGIDEAAAFSSYARIDETARWLSKAGVDIPVEMPFTVDIFGTLHSMAAWVWGNGGRFCAPNGKGVLFNSPEALAGEESYFGLLNYLSPKGRQMMLKRGGSHLFRSGGSAITFGSLMVALPGADIAPEVADNWGVAGFPGVSFVGGSNLAIWGHTVDKTAAVELVSYLASAQVQGQVYRPLAVIPSRLEVLQTAAIQSDPMLSVMAEAAQNGRSYLPIPLWGLIEDQLVEALVHMGNELLRNSDVDLQSYIADHINPVARKLNTALSK